MSAFTLLTIREVPEPAEASAADGLLYPIPGQQANTIEPEPLDGDDVVRLQARSVWLRFGDDKKPLLRASDIRMDVFVTGSRVAVACSKYDKGGGWIGGAGAIALNAGSKMLAARRRRGKMLVGQVRYPWLSGVFAETKSGLLSDEQLRLIVRIDDRDLLLHLTLPKNVDAAAVATEIAHRAARFRLTHETEMEDAERSAIEEISTVERFVSVKADKHMAGLRFPTVWPASERSALIGQGAVQVDA